MNVCRIFACLAVLSVAAPGQMRRSQRSSSESQVEIQPAASFKGVIKTVDGSKILLELPDGNIMEFRATRKSKFKVSGKDAKLKDLVSGQAAEIDGRYFLGGVDVVTVVVATARPK